MAAPSRDAFDPFPRCSECRRLTSFHGCGHELASPCPLRTPSRSSRAPEVASPRHAALGIAEDAR
eukprot:11493570-Alexandrium_andersonii.AAC.1